MKIMKNIIFTITLLVSVQAAVAMERPVTSADVQALHDAVKARNHALVEQLVKENGVPVDAKNAQGETPLLNYLKNVYDTKNIIRRRYTPTFWKKPVQYYHDMRKGQDSFISQDETRPIVKELHDYLTFASNERPIVSRDRRVISPDGTEIIKDYKASEYEFDGEIDYMDELLLELGANPNEQDASGLTPLVCVAKKADHYMVKQLVKVGAHPDLGKGSADITPWGFRVPFSRWVNPAVTALGFAVSNADVESVRTLIAAGANVNRADSYFQETPLRTAIRAYMCTHEYKSEEERAKQAKYSAIIDILLAAKADPNLKDCLNRSALRWAAFFQREELVAELLDAGADSNVKDYMDKTVFDHACQDYCGYFAHQGARQPMSQEDVQLQKDTKQNIKQIIKRGGAALPSGKILEEVLAEMEELEKQNQHMAARK